MSPITHYKITLNYNRRSTREVRVGNIGIGGKNPVSVQSMTNTDTKNVDATVQQVKKLVEAKCEIVRITAPTVDHAKALGEIKKNLREQGIEVPLVADIHFMPVAAMEAIKHVEKIRINPGNFLDRKLNVKKEYTDEEYQSELRRIEEGVSPLIEEARKRKVAIRLGTNHGSLSDRIMSRYGDTAEGMVESAIEYVKIFQKHDFEDLVVAMKASSPKMMVQANRLLAMRMEEEKMDYPIHLGVTEAGKDEDGVIKSSIGIGGLLMDGIGDTIRVSLTGDPLKEVPVAYNILQAAGVRITKAEFISCPSCGRTLYNIEEVANKIMERTRHLTGVKIAIMGCIVNGLGEMADADFGYVGSGPKTVNLYEGKKVMAYNIPQEKAVDELVELIKKSGKWIDPK